MPAPAMSSRHLYTEHRRGHIQPTPRLRAHRGGPLSRDHPQIPVSMPSLFRFDASAVVHTCSSSHRTPAPLTARRHPQRSPPRLLTDAACGGLESPPARRPRRTHLHHWHSTDRADDLLHHHHHFPSGHTWVPETRPWSLTCRDAGRSYERMARVLNFSRQRCDQPASCKPDPSSLVVSSPDKDLAHSAQEASGLTALRAGNCGQRFAAVHRWERGLTLQQSTCILAPQQPRWSGRTGSITPIAQ